MMYAFRTDSYQSPGGGAFVEVIERRLEAKHGVFGVPPHLGKPAADQRIVAECTDRDLGKGSPVPEGRGEAGVRGQPPER